MMVAPSWIEAHCVIPDMSHQGKPFILGDEQLLFVARHYDVKPDAVFNPAAELDLTLPQNSKGAAFVYRRSQLIRSQKWGKSPLVAALVCLEAVGPALFAGFAKDDKQVYRCTDHGCGCGWEYQYEQGEPMGRLWPTALIQITATSEDQTENTYDALRPMIELGPLAQLMPKTGEEFIRLPNGGRIDTVTSSGNTRLGQRVTFVIQDETALWTASNGGHNLAKKQRQGLAGMDGRAVETTNAYNPAENSVAQRTFEADVTDIQKDFRKADPKLDFKDPKQRRQIFEFNYAGAPWVNLDAIEALAVEMMVNDPTDAERFFGNRIVAGDGRWLTESAWAVKGDPIVVPDGTPVCLGFDGSDNNDFTGIRLETLDQYQFTPTYGAAGRPTVWRPTDWEGRIPRAEVRAAIEEIATRYQIIRAYCDPQFWTTEIDEWANQYGEKVFVKWPTSSLNRMWHALTRLKTDVTTPESKFRHDDCPMTQTHIMNAVMRARGLDTTTREKKYILGKPTDHQKIDLAMSSVLAHEATMDAVKASDEPAKRGKTIIYL